MAGLLSGYDRPSASPAGPSFVRANAPLIMFERIARPHAGDQSPPSVAPHADQSGHATAVTYVARPHRLVNISTEPIQRYEMTYGALNKNDVGTDMHVLIHGKYDPDFSKGSKPSVVPSWWPTGTDAVGTYFSSYMVQGHLLNDNLGGPGNTMQNLTPITRSTNTTHLKKVEEQVKAEVEKNNYVEYRVRPDYSIHPKMTEIGNSPPAGVAPYLDNMAGTIGADYTIYHPKNLNVIGGLPGEKFIKNEGPQLKGPY